MNTSGLLSLLESTANSKPKLRRLALILLAFHFVVTLGISTTGRAGLMPRTFDVNGNGVSFAADASNPRGHLTEIVTQSEILKRRGLADWAAYPGPFHTRLYSLSFFVFDPFGNSSILSAEPVNLALYALTLFLIFRIGAEIFNRKVGLIAASVIAIWPSYLIFSTQLLRDPQLIAAMLALFLAIIRLVARDYSVRQGILEATVGIGAVIVIWLLRGEEIEVILAISLVAIVSVAIRAIGEKRLLAGNLIVASSLALAAITTPRIVSRYSTPSALETDLRPPPGRSYLRIADRIQHVRLRFITLYPGAGSNLDADVQFNSTSDIIRYLPRAAEIGFLSPFPYMWFASGSKLGRSGRIISGLETVPLYVLEIFALFALWHWRRRFAVWLLLSIATLGLTALGLVVVNVGTLYRLRYAFVMLLVVLGSAGVWVIAGVVGIDKSLDSNDSLRLEQ